ncbi:BAI1-associated protein 3 isoform X1 [Leptopilina boulardi]|uniref:BAI1-associated protein 3 isoform X1 n=2 Tax=Leptopilina boulardi TaxID=63433 RepID=UPI0021F563C8|nr:BAI1-associated protein 3 isoform X1 [Leptopilina boulardi]
MSFFNSLHQYVSDSVASLNLGTKRFSFSREESTTTGAGRSGSTGSVTSTTNSTTTTHHGFPKVVPPPGTTTPPHARSLSSRRRTLDSTFVPGLSVHPAAGGGGGQLSPRRVGSFRRSKGSTDRPPLMFCRRRPSWPEVDNEATSGVQETDGSFFESFTALSWKQENRRLIVLQEVEARAEEAPPPSRDFNLNTSQNYRMNQKEMEQLYREVLYTIANRVGASTGPYAQYKEDLYKYAQEAFSVPQDQHRRFLNIASEEKPPIVVLNVLVVEAEGLEAKDANGYSDPYCMLGIQPGNSSSLPSPQTNLPGHSPHTAPPSPRQTTRALSDGGCEIENSHHEKLRKHSSFRIASFKRKEQPSRREHRESISGEVPAKYIRATSVKHGTLNPRWEEKFPFVIDDINTDIIHLDIWDHDDESSVLDAVSKLNEVRGVKGLGRFFKQIAQSARSGSQDDFLGCVNIPVQDIPSTGLEGWYKLQARTQRSNIQGRIKLKLWLSTRENRGTSEEDNWGELRQQERLYTVFLNHEINKLGKDFNGELSQIPMTILHQHAVQGDITDLQQAIVRWVASARQSSVDPKTLYRFLQDIENMWHPNELSLEEVQYLADSFNAFLDVTLKKVRQHRVLFPPLHQPAISKLDNLLRCLGLLSIMSAYRKCCPFNKEMRWEIITALRKGTLEWYQDTRQQTMGRDQEPDQDQDRVLQDFTNLVTALLVDLEQGQIYYNSLFEHTNGVPYFSAVYKQLEKLLAEHVAKHMENTSEMHDELGARVTTACLQIHAQDREDYVLPPGAEIGTPIFELYLALQEFMKMKKYLPQSDHKTLAICKYYEWFKPAVDKWLDLAKLKAMQRVRRASELDRICTGEYIVKHCTSAIDAISCFDQMKEFWNQLEWPDIPGSYSFVLKVVDAICTCGSYYAELTHQKLADSGYYDDQGPYKTTDEVNAQMCVAVNGLEYVRRWMENLGEMLHIEDLFATLEGQAVEAIFLQWRHTMISPLEQTLGQMMILINQIISRTGAKMRPPLKKAMFHLAWSPDSLPTSEAIAPLVEYLDVHLVALNSSLLSTNFFRVLQVVWEVVLSELYNQMDGSAADKPPLFYERLHEALEYLVSFFYADEKGLTYDIIRCEIFLNIEERLEYHKMDTTLLIDRYYQQRLQDQMNTFTVEYGVLTVRAYFNHDSLCVEVISARDVIPLDPNGLSDPFVIIELLPRRVFAHCSEQQTNVKKKTLNPLFDECFEFSVSVEQCRSPDSMVLFTVMDHDVLTANDFAGEAFLGLSSIPGVADSNASIDNFHGLKHQELPLMQQKNKYHPILQILESRTGDKLALDFVKKQKLRFAT